MEERLQKILSAHAIASRRAAEQLILAGRVTVNGKVAELGQRADPQRDRIAVDGRPIGPMDARVCLLLHKPRGYVTTLSDELGRKTVADLVADCGMRVYPVGRLDYGSEGLLLLTNDGTLAHQLMHPKGNVEKEYEVTVRGDLANAEEKLARPIVMDGRPIQPPQVRLLRKKEHKATYSIVIHEGRNRQIRRMCEAAGLEVLRLCRVREGALHLGDLPCGTWRYLTSQELQTLIQDH